MEQCDPSSAVCLRLIYLAPSCFSCPLRGLTTGCSAVTTPELLHCTKATESVQLGSSSAHAALRCAGAPLGAILNFLLQLGFREVGSAFRVDALSSVERTIAADVAQLGLLMPFMYAPSATWKESTAPHSSCL